MAIYKSVAMNNIYITDYVGFKIVNYIKYVPLSFD